MSLPAQHPSPLEFRPVGVLPREGEDPVVGEAVEVMLVVVDQALVGHSVVSQLGLDGVKGLGAPAAPLGLREAFSGEVARGFLATSTVMCSTGKVRCRTPAKSRKGRDAVAPASSERLLRHNPHAPARTPPTHALAPSPATAFTPPQWRLPPPSRSSLTALWRAESVFFWGSVAPRSSLVWVTKAVFL